VDQAQQARRPIAELTPSRERGWVGLIVLLLALVIVAVLAQTVLKSYGMLGAAASASPDTAAAPAPMTPIERARGVEQTVKQGEEDMSKRIDEQTK